VGCAAALATLDVIEEERLLEHAQHLGGRALERLRDMQRRLPLIADVRGAGLLIGVELVEPATGKPAREAAERILYTCLAAGLSFKVGQGNVLVLAPPLVIDEPDLMRAMDIVESAIMAIGP
jgi:4-aminobutyrate aminotransferase